MHLYIIICQEEQKHNAESKPDNTISIFMTKGANCLNLWAPISVIMKPETRIRQIFMDCAFLNYKKKCFQLRTGLSMMSLWHGYAFRIIEFLRGPNRSPVDSPHKGPVKLSLDISLDISPNKLLNKQLRGRWIEMSWRWLDLHCNNYSGVTWAWWRLKSTKTPLFVQLIVQAHIKENIKGRVAEASNVKKFLTGCHLHRARPAN